MRRWWRTPRACGMSKRQSNRILKQQLEDDWKEVMDVDTEASTSNSYDMPREDNPFLEKQLEEDWKELMDQDTGACASASNTSATGRDSSDSIPEVVDEEWSSESDSNNINIQEVQETSPTRESSQNEDNQNILR